MLHMNQYLYVILNLRKIDKLVYVVLPGNQ
jgi:hypothetical protein